jgi:Cys-rich repeat protein
MRAAGVIALVLCACQPVDWYFDKDGGEHDGGHDAGLPCGGCGGLSSLVCDEDAGACVECLTDAQCFAPYGACDPKEHRCFQCVTSLDCGSGQACEPTTHHCGKTCTSVIDCPLLSADHCSMGGICGTCDDLNDCSMGLQCDTATARCQECAKDSDCPGDRPFCDRSRGKCVECIASSDCGDRTLCDPRTESCVSP